jgi:hypothetical protein
MFDDAIDYWLAGLRRTERTIHTSRSGAEATLLTPWVAFVRDLLVRGPTFFWVRGRFCCCEDVVVELVPEVFVEVSVISEIASPKLSVIS